MKMKTKFDEVISIALKRLAELGHKEENIFGIFLYGSQNYELDDEKSDFDLKVILIPTVREIIAGKEISKVYDFEYGQLEVKTINKYKDLFKKGNPAYIEILATKYYYSNPRYKMFVERMRSMGIDSMNLQSTIKAFVGMSLQKEKALFKEYPSIRESIKEFGYDKKQIYHIRRLNIMLEKLYNKAKGGNWSLYPNDYIIPTNEERAELLNLKYNTIETEKIKELSEEFIKKTREYEKFLLDNKTRGESTSLEFKIPIWENLEDLIYQVIVQHSARELNENFIKEVIKTLEEKWR